MSRPTGTVILVLGLVATSAGAGCLDRLLEGQRDPGTAQVGANADLPGGNGTDTETLPPEDPAPTEDPWQAAYERWRACDRNGGPIMPCPHPHPVTESPADPSPMPHRLSVRHHVTDASWIAIVMDVHPAPVPFREARLDVHTPDARGTMVGRPLSDSAAFYFHVNQSSTCVDCSYAIAMTELPYPPEHIGYRVSFDDADADAMVSLGDRFILERDASNTTNRFDAPLLPGHHMVRLDDASGLEIRTDEPGPRRTPLVTTSPPREPGWTLTVRHDFGTDTPRATAAVLELRGHDVTIPLTDAGDTTQVRYVSDDPNRRRTCHTRDDCVTDQPPWRGPAFRITFHDADGDGRFLLDDTIRIDHDVGNGTNGARTWDHPFPFGDYRVALHDTHGHTIATGTGTVHDGRTP